MKNIELKVGIFIFLTSLMIAGFVYYVADKKGLFEESIVFKLSTRSADGISSGMPILFSGFKIGEISGMNLRDDGTVLLFAKVPQNRSKWINNTSEFVLDKPLIGSTKIVVNTSDLTSSYFDLEATYRLKTFDGINELIIEAQPLVILLGEIMQHVSDITKTLSEKESLVAMATGENSSGKEMAKTIEETTKLLELSNEIIKNTNSALYGKDGLMIEIHKSLEKIDEILANAVLISEDTASSTKDIERIKDEVDLALKNANILMKDINKLVPFKDKAEVKLP